MGELRALSTGSTDDVSQQDIIHSAISSYPELSFGTLFCGMGKLCSSLTRRLVGPYPRWYSKARKKTMDCEPRFETKRFNRTLTSHGGIDDDISRIYEIIANFI